MNYGYYQPYQQPIQDQLQQYRNMQMSPSPMSGTSQDERIWVSSASAAEAYLMTPNSFVRLWDSNQPVFYERRTDAQGRPYPMDTFRYAREDNTARNNTMQSNYDDRFRKLEMRLSEIERSIGGGQNVSESNANDQPV